MNANENNFDWFVAFAFVGATFDAATTIYFLANKIGVEGNNVLAPLAGRSLIWVPAYCYSLAVLILFMGDGVRQSFAMFYGSMTFLAGASNLSGILTGTWILRLFTFDLAYFTGIALGAATFAFYFLAVANDVKYQRRKKLLHAFVWILVFNCVELLFYKLRFVV